MAIPPLMRGTRPCLQFHELAPAVGHVVRDALNATVYFPISLLQERGSDSNSLETRPVCRRCARNNASCGYGIRLVWHEESLARGICHGRSGVWSKRKDSQQKNTSYSQQEVKTEDKLLQPYANAIDRPWMFLNTTMVDLQVHFDGVQSNRKYSEAYLQASSLLPRLNTFPSEQRSDFDPFLMTYFERVICSRSTLVDNAHCNPYRYLILPMALQSEGLYHAALAIAANTLRLSDQRYRLLALEHHHQALKHLRILLNQDSWMEKEVDEMLGLVLMLCWFDVRISLPLVTILY
jgi:hypothetical protein